MKICISIFFSYEYTILASLIQGVRVPLLLALVNSVDVCQNMGAAWPSVFTVRTLVRPLSSVCSKVTVQVVFESKTFSTKEAGVAWPGSWHWVHLQVKGGQWPHTRVCVWVATIFCFTESLKIKWLPCNSCGVLGCGETVEALSEAGLGAAYILVHSALRLQNVWSVSHCLSLSSII